MTLFNLISQCFFCFYKCIRDSCWVLSTCLSHVRTTTAASANKTCDCFHKISGMCSLLHCSVCCCSHQAYFSVIS